MPLDLGVSALGVVGATSIALFVLGVRFHRIYVFKYDARPPSPWIFKPTRDPDLERPRRLALVLLPIDIAAMVFYLSRL